MQMPSDGYLNKDCFPLAPKGKSVVETWLMEYVKKWADP